MNRRSFSGLDALVVIMLIALAGWTIGQAYAPGHTIALPLIVLAIIYRVIKRILFGD